jgi:hypothetical protein
MRMIEDMAREWLALVALAASGPDPKTFRAAIDSYAKKWSRLKMNHQGEVCHLLRLQ